MTEVENACETRTTAQLSSISRSRCQPASDSIASDTMKWCQAHSYRRARLKDRLVFQMALRSKIRNKPPFGCMTVGEVGTVIYDIALQRQ